jgi:hypothetical protein
LTADEARWLIPLPAIVLAFWPTVVSAIEVPPNPYYNAPQNLTTEQAANNGITIMTLSGTVQNWALFFTFLSLALHLAGVLTKDGEDHGDRSENQ